MRIQETIHDSLPGAQERHRDALSHMTASSATGYGVTVWQLITTISAMKLEIQTGIKPGRGVNVFKNVKAIFGWTGNKKTLLAKLQKYKFENHPIPAFGACPQCGKVALVEVSEAVDGPVMDFTDGTNMHCHPIYGGCNTGFTAPQSMLDEVKAWRKGSKHRA